MKTRRPFAASVIMTVRDEPHQRLADALSALAGQVGLPGPLEVVVATPPTDTDAVAAAVAGLGTGGAIASVTLAVNPGGGRSAGLNRAVRAATAELLVRVDARCRVAPDHVARCLARLRAEPTVGVVGGGQRAVVAHAADNGSLTGGIARALTNPWVLGAAPYRRPGASGPVDTVYLGAFRREQLLALGGYDERLEANEDFELCRRYRAAGLVVWLEPGLAVDYEPRDELADLWRQYVAFGRSKVRFWWLTGALPNARQSLALVAAPLALVSAAALLAVAPQPWLLAAALLAGGGLGAFAIDSRAGPQHPTWTVRAWSIVASGVVVTGWLSGVATELADTFALRFARVLAGSVPVTSRRPAA